MNPCEMSNIQIADYILSLQSDVDGFPFSSNEIIREAAKRLLTEGDDDISKDAEIEELRELLLELSDAANTAFDAIAQCGSIIADGDVRDAAYRTHLMERIAKYLNAMERANNEN